MEEKPFKITGEINLGKIDLLAERDRAINELNALKGEKEEEIKASVQENQKLREQIHHMELEIIRLDFKAQIESLAKMVESARSKASLSEQLDTFKELAEKLGYTKVSEGTSLAEIIGRAVAKAILEK